MASSSSRIKWDCPQCQITIFGRGKYCKDCQSMLVWTCIASGKSGLYTNYYRHHDRCTYCSPELEQEREEIKQEKQIGRIQKHQTLFDGECASSTHATGILFIGHLISLKHLITNNDDVFISYIVEQRPWSEWSSSDNSCIQHTGHDIEQVERLYSMCKQSLVEYCANRKQQYTKTSDVALLSPMNLLAVTLWYLKHYHTERYIASEFEFNQPTVNYFLSAVIDILHSCVFTKLISLPDDMEDGTTAHGPEEYQKLIVDSTFIAIHQPEDSEIRKKYYHAKSSTNYAFKIQIACDFNHRIVHVSECYHGSVHDINILRQSGLLEYTGEDVQIIADKGYVGEQFVITPKKKPRGGELTDGEKDFNRIISAARAAIENINQRVKQYAIIGHIYRGSYDDFHKITKIAQVVCALCNLNLDAHPIRNYRS